MTPCSKRSIRGWSAGRRWMLPNRNRCPQATRSIGILACVYPRMHLFIPPRLPNASPRNLPKTLHASVAETRSSTEWISGEGIDRSYGESRMLMRTPTSPLDALSASGKIETTLPPFDAKTVPIQPTLELERLYRKQRLAAAYRLFARNGYDMGGAGHITARYPEFTDQFWVNPQGVHFSRICVSELMLVNHEGQVI